MCSNLGLTTLTSASAKLTELHNAYSIRVQLFFWLRYILRKIGYQIMHIRLQMSITIFAIPEYLSSCVSLVSANCFIQHEYSVLFLGVRSKQTHLLFHLRARIILEPTSFLKKYAIIAVLVIVILLIVFYFVAGNTKKIYQKYLRKILCLC